MKRWLIWAPTAVFATVGVVAMEVALVTPGMGAADNLAAGNIFLTILTATIALPMEMTR